MKHTQSKVWDPLVRVGHWTLAAAFTAAYLSGDDSQPLHLYAGYALLGIVLVRQIWGLVGTPPARFASFVRPWQDVRSHLRAVARLSPPVHPGHNPAGGWMVVILLTALLATALTGVAAYGEGGGILGTGLTGLGHDAKEGLEEVHELLAGFTLFLVFIHMGGVLVESLLTGENLPKGMVTGRRNLTNSTTR